MSDESKKTFFVGLKAIIVRDDKVLLLKKDGKRTFWDAPGGCINKGETPEQAIVRELCEELPSIDEIMVDRLLNAHVLDRDIKDGVSLTLLFYKVEAALADVTLSDEHSDYEWMSFEKAREVGSEGIAAAIDAL